MLTQDKTQPSAAKSPIETQSQQGGTSPRTQPAYVVLTGNPNSGKTTVFNAFTGLRARVGNYAGVTVERKEGRLQGTPSRSAHHDAGPARHLQPQPAIARRTNRARRSASIVCRKCPRPALSSWWWMPPTCERNLYFATQVIELGYPTIIALEHGRCGRRQTATRSTPKNLSQRLGVPVIPIVASTGQGIPELRKSIVDLVRTPPKRATPNNFANCPPRLPKRSTPLSELLADAFHERHASGARRSIADFGERKILPRSASHIILRTSFRRVEAARAAVGSRRTWTGAARPSKPATPASPPFSKQSPPKAA